MEKGGEGKARGGRNRGKGADRNWKGRRAEEGTRKGGTLELVTPTGVISPSVPPCPRKGRGSEAGAARDGGAWHPRPYDPS